MERFRISHLSGKDIDTSFPYNEKESSVSIIPLTTFEGQEKLESTLTRSHGAAAVVVHPFYLESTFLDGAIIPPYRDKYRNYMNRLKTAVGKYQNLGLPLILFEEESNKLRLQSKIGRLGITKGNIFVVPTRSASPEPETGNLTKLAKQLREVGLRRVSVSGSYLWFIDRNYRGSPLYYNEGMPPITKNFALEGCVGYTVITFLNAGVMATPAFATYPGRKDPLLY